MGLDVELRTWGQTTEHGHGLWVVFHISRCFFYSFAATELPIWKVVRVESDGTRTPLTDEGAWDATWLRISELRAHDPVGRYACDHSTKYSKVSPDDL
jgi:hypothetical protein